MTKLPSSWRASAYKSHFRLFNLFCPLDYKVAERAKLNLFLFLNQKKVLVSSAPYSISNNQIGYCVQATVLMSFTTCFDGPCYIIFAQFESRINSRKTQYSSSRPCLRLTTHGYELGTLKLDFSYVRKYCSKQSLKSVINSQSWVQQEKWLMIA